MYLISMTYLHKLLLLLLLKGLYFSLDLPFGLDFSSGTNLFFENMSCILCCYTKIHCMWLEKIFVIFTFHTVFKQEEKEEKKKKKWESSELGRLKGKILTKLKWFRTCEACDNSLDPIQSAAFHCRKSPIFLAKKCLQKQNHQRKLEKRKKKWKWAVFN